MLLNVIYIILLCFAFVGEPSDFDGKGINVKQYRYVRRVNIGQCEANSQGSLLLRMVTL